MRSASCRATRPSRQSFTATGPARASSTRPRAGPGRPPPRRGGPPTRPGPPRGLRSGGRGARGAARCPCGPGPPAPSSARRGGGRPGGPPRVACRWSRGCLRHSELMFRNLGYDKACLRYHPARPAASPRADPSCSRVGPVTSWRSASPSLARADPPRAGGSRRREVPPCPPPVAVTIRIGS